MDLFAFLVGLVDLHVVDAEVVLHAVQVLQFFLECFHAFVELELIPLQSIIFPLPLFVLSFILSELLV